MSGQLDSLDKNAKNIAYLRKCQIDSLWMFNQNVVEIKTDEVYSVGFELAGRTFQLDVLLSPDFPRDIPDMVLSPTVNHPWVHPGTGSIQNAPALVDFTFQFDVGRVVHTIIKELQHSMPTVVDNGLQTNPNKKPATVASSSGIQSDMDSISAKTATIPDLDTLSMEDLFLLHKDATYLSDFVEEQVMKELNQTVDSLMEEVETMLEENLSKKSKLMDLLAATEQRRAKMISLGDQYDTTSKRYQEKAEQFAPSHIKELLQIAGSNAESECEIHVDDFLDGRIEASAFLDRYIKLKVLSTVRKAKSDRLGQQLNALERATF